MRVFVEVWVYGGKTILLRTQQMLGITNEAKTRTAFPGQGGSAFVAAVGVAVTLAVCFFRMSCTHCSPNLNHSIFVLTHCRQEIVGLHKRGVFGSMHTAAAMQNQKSVWLCLFSLCGGGLLLFW